MSHHKIEVRGQCKSCKATGLYRGMAEGKGCAVVCISCKGTGEKIYTLEYDDFKGRVGRSDVEWVYECNPGIGVGNGHGYRFADFGGMSHSHWVAGVPFARGMENRESTCPAWWYQSADYKRKPDWDECIGIGSFSGCKQFPNKRKCWARFDAENK